MRMDSPSLREQLVADGEVASRRRTRLFRIACEELRMIVARRVANQRCRPALCVYGGHLVTCLLARWKASFTRDALPNEDELRLAIADLVQVGAIVAQPPYDGMFLIHRCDRN